MVPPPISNFHHLAADEDAAGGQKQVSSRLTSLLRTYSILSVGGNVATFSFEEAEEGKRYTSEISSVARMENSRGYCICTSTMSATASGTGPPSRLPANVSTALPFTRPSSPICSKLESLTEIGSADLRFQTTLESPLYAHTLCRLALIQELPFTICTLGFVRRRGRFWCRGRVAVALIHHRRN